MDDRKIPEDPTTIKSDANLPTEYGNFRVRVMRDEDEKEHVLLYTGLEKQNGNFLVRIHSECLTGDAFGSMKCDCGAQLQKAMKAIQEEGSGAIVYMRQEGRGIGLEAKIKAYALQDRGLDTLDANLALNLPADARDYSFAAEMLKSVNVNEVELMTNNPHKVDGLNDNGVFVVKRKAHISGICAENRDYLNTKSARMGHILPLQQVN